MTAIDLHQGQLRSPVKSQCPRRVAALESHRSQAHRPASANRSIQACRARCGWSCRYGCPAITAPNWVFCAPAFA